MRSEPRPVDRTMLALYGVRVAYHGHDHTGGDRQSECSQEREAEHESRRALPRAERC
jgi:hypothetical protein